MAGAPYRLRAGSIADLAAIPAIERDAAQLYRAVGYDFCADGPVRHAHEITAALDRGTVEIAETEAGMPVGFALALPIDGGAHLLELAVARPHQGRGLGRRLIAAVAAWATAQGHGELTLTTFRDVPWNAPAYARMGFVLFTPGPDRPALRAIQAEEGPPAAPRHRASRCGGRSGDRTADTLEPRPRAGRLDVMAWSLAQVIHVTEEPLMARDVVRMAANGRLVVPAELRAAIGMRHGGTLVVEVENGTLRLVPFADVVRRVQEEVARYVDPERSLADELMAERREEAARE
jgi:GNAT superfamily N-acetyltransferase/bifunctional DNA-binding transcriptional regulator/antitoxin component of YhaV-PrlF toxin-antitoxin module